MSVNVAIISGSRAWANQSVVNKTIENIPSDWHIIVGGARGPDTWAEDRARGLGRTVIRMPAEWNLHKDCHCKDQKEGSVCKYAGFRRNIEMLERGQSIGPCLVIAFWDGESSGTAHTIQEAKRRGIPVKLITGTKVPDNVLTHEQESRTNSRSMADWRQDEAALRQGFESFMDEPTNDSIMPEVLTAYLDFMELERQKWDDNLHEKPHSRQHVVQTSIKRTRTVNGAVVERSFKPAVTTTLPTRWEDPLKDSDELVNLEDYTMDELALLEHPSLVGKTNWRVEHHIPLDRATYDAWRATI